MKKIILLIILFSPSIIFANTTLRPPTLEEIMKKNIENQEKVLLINDNQTENLTYKTLYSGKSITIKKANENNLYIQEIDLLKGAKLDGILKGNGFIKETGEPLFERKNINELLSLLLRKPTSVINGQFFNPKINPTTLSFAVKLNGKIRTTGADNKKNIKLLIIEGTTAKIVPYSWKNLQSSKGDFAFSSFDFKQSSYPNQKIGRAYLCLKNPTKNNSSSTILTFFSQSIKQGDIEKEILKNGCNQEATLQLDSSGSSRLYFNGEITYGFGHKEVPDYRKLPHYILFYE